MKPLVFAALAALLSLPAQAQITGTPGPVTAQGFLACPASAHSRALCQAYIGGVASGLSMAGELCLRPNVSLYQMGFIVHRYIENHPGEMDEYPDRAIRAALTQAFPC